MIQIIIMFLVVVFFWLVVEVINNRINKNRKLVKLVNEPGNEK